MEQFSTKRVVRVCLFAAAYTLLASLLPIPFFADAQLSLGYAVLVIACSLMPALDAMIVGAAGAAAVDLFAGALPACLPHLLCNLILAYGLRGLLAAEAEFEEELPALDPAERKAGRVRLVVVFVTGALMLCAAAVFVGFVLECLLSGSHPLALLPRAVATFGADCLVILISYPVVLLVRRALQKDHTTQP